MDYNQEQKQDRKNLLWAALAVLALLNLVLLYFFYQERQENVNKDTIIAAKTEEVLNTKTKLDSISVQLDAKIAEIQQLGGSVDSLVALKEQLERDKQNLRISNASSIKQYEGKIRSYEAVLAQKDQDIRKLREELGIVTSRNEELSQKVTGLQSERQALSDSVTTYSSRNRELSEKVSLASALRAEEISVNAITTKGKEREGGSFRARRVDKIKVNFRLGENPIAQQNQKEIYLRILDPNGAVLSDMATGSGAFMHNGREILYSSKGAVNYTNSRQAVDILYGRGGTPLKEGKYTVELYSEGFKIGQSDFTIR
ncbi:hypothetical protein [Telluribacter sp. SYSU D00476]|uniref:hypothetical protein n=1 Tax=Telluribacter sp. SYSU D00476 TaxID=2811430 RepID=UPI001FF3A9AF|nr:hypothetical protein [Telluribacter sp. SYSU D00476]